MSKAKKPKAPKRTPCEQCSGFKVPARRVASVARDGKGRFVKKRQRSLI